MNGHADIVPVFEKGERFLVVALTQAFALVVKSKDMELASVTEMLEYVPNSCIRYDTVQLVQNWDKRPLNEVEFFRRSRAITSEERNNNIRDVFYIWVRDGAFDERLRRYKSTLNK